MTLIVFVIAASVCSQIGMLIGSIWDKGNRSDGDMRKDIPSTIGFLAGIILLIYFM